MTVNLSCIIPLLVVLGVVLLFFTITRRILLSADEIALFGLMFNGLRSVVGVQRFTLGCLMVAGLASGLVVFLVLIAFNTASCFAENPSEFCALFPFLAR